MLFYLKLFTVYFKQRNLALNSATVTKIWQKIDIIIKQMKYANTKNE